MLSFIFLYLNGRWITHVQREEVRKFETHTQARAIENHLWDSTYGYTVPSCDKMKLSLGPSWAAFCSIFVAKKWHFNHQNNFWHFHAIKKMPALKLLWNWSLDKLATLLDGTYKNQGNLFKVNFQILWLNHPQRR